MNHPPTDFARQTQLIAALRDPGRYPHPAKAVRVIETHISWVLLAGRYAYKIKKALNLGFLDFSSLQDRRFYCAEEIRLNRRLAPQLYLDVMPICGSPQQPLLAMGSATPIEYAVRMRRFSSGRQLDRLLARDKVQPRHIDSLATLLARFHRSLPAVAPDAPAPDAPYGSATAIRAAALQNFAQLPALLEDEQAADSLAALQAATEAELSACAAFFVQRHAQGYVRECHGDLHLANIALIGEQAVPFDGIDFNPALRWIDVISDAAFTFMDLLHYGRPQLAYRFLNAYLEASGDYAAIRGLRLYTAYRATVRAKVSAIRAAQGGIRPSEKDAALAACGQYLELAASSLQRRRPALIITHGLPGSGKTTFAQAALERLQAIRIRSDVERKRLFGLAALDHSRDHPVVGNTMYSAAASRRTFERLHDIARDILAAGYTVIVDAAFLRKNERDMFRALATEMALPFAIAATEAAPQLLQSRIAQRMAQADDASEADLAVLAMLQKVQEELAPQEHAYTARFINQADHAGFAADAPGWDRLAQLLTPQPASSAAGIAP